jgi:hypothetical protein
VGGILCSRRVLPTQWICSFHNRVIENGGYIDPSDMDDHKNKVDAAILIVETLEK